MQSSAATGAEVIIRKAAEADLPVIRAIIQAARINPLGLDWRRFMVAEADGQIIGTGQVKPHRDGSRELASVAVMPEWQGQRVASALIRELMAREDGVLYLICEASLEAFYRPFGFRRVRRREMTPYFRNISRLALLLWPFTFLVVRGGLRLIVMRSEAAHG